MLSTWFRATNTSIFPSSVIPIPRVKIGVFAITFGFGRGKTAHAKLLQLLLGVSEGEASQ